MVFKQMTTSIATNAASTSSVKRCRDDSNANDYDQDEQQQQQQQQKPPNATSSPRNPNRQNHVLLLTVIKPLYPITVDVLHKICSPFGNVLRIVIFRKNGVQAMVEFENIEIATLAKTSLDGADIYSDCCTLKVEYAKPERLSVYKNYSLTWDFTKTSKESGADVKQPLLQDPPALMATAGYGYDGADGVMTKHKPLGKYPLANRSDSENGMAFHPKRKMMRTELSTPPPPPPPPLPPSHRYYPLQSHQQQQHYYDQDDENDVYESRHHHTEPMSQRRQPLLQHGHMPEHYSHDGSAVFASSGAAGSSFAAANAPGSVLMVYGLDPANANPEKLFNILCLYGNVLKVKFLKTKEGTAMVEMGDAYQADKCVSHLTNIVCSSFGGGGSGGSSSSTGTGTGTSHEHFQEFKFQLQISKQNFLSDVASPFRLPDGSLSFRDFSNSKNNRYLTLRASNKNRYTSPCKIVHFFNTPPHVTDNELIDVFRRYNVPTPIRIHRLAARSEKSSTGFLEFCSIGDAVAAIVCCNHAAVESSESKFPFIMKLCFSSYKNEVPANGLRSPGDGLGF